MDEMTRRMYESMRAVPEDEVARLQMQRALLMQNCASSSAIYGDMMNAFQTAPIGYGWTIRWNGGRDRISVEGCASRQEAYDKAIDFATSSGWTMPKWWQFWRWGDDRPKPPVAAQNSPTQPQEKAA